MRGTREVHVAHGFDALAIAAIIVASFWQRVCNAGIVKSPFAVPTAYKRLTVGATVGATVGNRVGVREGALEGLEVVGVLDGAFDGAIDGAAEGREVVGADEGAYVVGGVGLRDGA